MRVAALMSGGVDSAVAALLLKEKGHDVTGVHMRILPSDDPSRARKLAEKLGIDFINLDLVGYFEASVIRYFISEYASGRTPNPCYMCNRWIKFGKVLEILDSLGFDLIASGHYAKVVDGKLFKARDIAKDQSYFLSSLPRIVLKRLILPLGEMRKEDVKGIFKERFGYSPPDESQDVCFLKGRKLKDFLMEKGLRPGKGKFVTKDGEVVGEHDGFAFFTIGQRKGLGVSLGRRVYVCKIDPRNNLVILGDKEDVMYDMMIVTDLNFLEDLPREFEAEVKVRSNFDPVGSRVRIEEGRAIVEFERKVFAVTPGQVAVFYVGDQVVLSGIIERGVRT